LFVPPDSSLSQQQQYFFKRGEADGTKVIGLVGAALMEDMPTDKQGHLLLIPLVQEHPHAVVTLLFLILPSLRQSLVKHLCFCDQIFLQ